MNDSAAISFDQQVYQRTVWPSGRFLKAKEKKWWFLKVPAGPIRIPAVANNPKESAVDEKAFKNVLLGVKQS